MLRRIISPITQKLAITPSMENNMNLMRLWL